ncbi:hypothetical protein LCGC14_2342500 [marine sediment metagenome]|uniref:Uncharacterized protein n=1 Tax=marine sediment metagenome TaxID=412755 RepID=A0A0F9EPC0_9ZZZZ
MALRVGQRQVRIDAGELKEILYQRMETDEKIVGASVQLGMGGTPDTVILTVEKVSEEETQD